MDRNSQNSSKQTRMTGWGSRVLLIMLKAYGIDHDKLGWFVLDNATNNDMTLVDERSKSIPFDPLKKRLRCAGHIYIYI